MFLRERKVQSNLDALAPFSLPFSHGKHFCGNGELKISIAPQNHFSNKCKNWHERLNSSINFSRSIYVSLRRNQKVIG